MNWWGPHVVANSATAGNTLVYPGGFTNPASFHGDAELLRQMRANVGKTAQAGDTRVHVATTQVTGSREVIRLLCELQSEPTLISQGFSYIISIFPHKGPEKEVC